MSDILEDFRTPEGKLQNVALVAMWKVERLLEIEKAARNLISVKGRHHSEQAYKQLEEVLK
jgi:hypothetical protein